MSSPTNRKGGEGEIEVDNTPRDNTGRNYKSSFFNFKDERKTRFKI